VSNFTYTYTAIPVTTWTGGFGSWTDVPKWTGGVPDATMRAVVQQTAPGAGLNYIDVSGVANAFTLDMKNVPSGDYNFIELTAPGAELNIARQLTAREENNLVSLTSGTALRVGSGASTLFGLGAEGLTTNPSVVSVAAGGTLAVATFADAWTLGAPKRMLIKQGAGTLDMGNAQSILATGTAF
jgi:hypothetical protein